jgi:hypothetical protein
MEVKVDVKHSLLDGSSVIDVLLVAGQETLDQVALAADFCDFLGPPVRASFAASISTVRMDAWTKSWSSLSACSG